MGVEQTLVLVFVGLLFLGNLGLIVFITRDKKRFRKYRRNMYLFCAFLFSISLLMKVLLPENCCLGLLIIPIFFFGPCYIFYDAFIK
jgi:predicted membrane metal-binding protein